MVMLVVGGGGSGDAGGDAGAYSVFVPPPVLCDY